MSGGVDVAVEPPRAETSSIPVGRASRRRGRGDAVRRKLMVADVLGLALAYALVQAFFGAAGGSDPVSSRVEIPLFVVSLPAWLVLARAMGLYDRDESRPEHTTPDDLVGVAQLVTMCVWLIFVISKVFAFADPDLGKWLIFWVLAISAVTIGRAAARLVARRSPNFVQNALIVGTDPTGQLAGRKIVQHPEYGIRLVGFVDGRPLPRRPELEGVPVLGDPDDLLDLVQTHEVDRVLVAFSGPVDRVMMGLARRLQLLGVQVDTIPRLFEAVGPTARVHAIEGLPLVSLPPTRLDRDALLLKRVFDTAVAAVSLCVAWPVLLAIAAWIKLDSPGPVFFRQTRLGLNQRPFTALKFRTMRADTSSDEHRAYISRVMSADAEPEADGLYKLERRDTVTVAGRWLRRTSLDELPQLLNVLRGDMSMVGPRPCIPYETELFAPHHFERFSVPAGITGLWQVKARGKTTFVEALEMDVVYARSWSFWRDVVLLIETPLQMLRPRGAR